MRIISFIEDAQVIRDIGTAPYILWSNFLDT